MKCWATPGHARSSVATLATSTQRSEAKHLRDLVAIKSHANRSSSVLAILGISAGLGSLVQPPGASCSLMLKSQSRNRSEMQQPQQKEVYLGKSARLR